MMSSYPKFGAFLICGAISQLFALVTHSGEPSLRVNNGKLLLEASTSAELQVECNHLKSYSDFIIFVTVDGAGVGGAKGMDISELAALMKIIGAKDAFNLDGGGSTSMYLTASSGEGEVVNGINEVDRNRDIGNALVLFDESLKKRPSISKN